MYCPKSSSPDSEFVYTSSKRHPYNTRSSTRNNYFDPSQTSLRGRNCSQQELLDQFNNSMDYCDYPQQNQQRQQESTICWLCCFLLIILAVIMLYFDIQKLKDDMSSIQTGGSKQPSQGWKIDLLKGKKQTDAFLQDPVGRADYALESTGGKIVLVDAIAWTKSSRSFFGIELCEGHHGPSSMLRVTHAPGECWAFAGNSARAVIQLIDEVIVDAVTLEHIPAKLSPSGSIDTAPKEFKIWGLTKPYDRYKKLLGTFVYSATGGAVQTFQITNQTNNHYKFIEFEVISNHGNPDFTCVYRLRVHTSIATKK